MKGSNFIKRCQKQLDSQWYKMFQSLCGNTCNDFTFENKLLANNLAWPLKMKLPSATNTEILLKFNLVNSNICNGHIFSSGCYYKGIYFIGDAIDYSGNDKFQYL